MNGRRKMEYQSRELERLRNENKELQTEWKILNKELERKDKAIAELKEENDGICVQIKDMYAKSAEDSKKLNEAREFYLRAIRSARKIEQEYKELVSKLKAELNYIEKGGV